MALSLALGLGALIATGGTARADGGYGVLGYFFSSNPKAQYIGHGHHSKKHDYRRHAYKRYFHKRHGHYSRPQYRHYYGPRYRYYHGPRYRHYFGPRYRYKQVYTPRRDLWRGHGHQKYGYKQHGDRKYDRRGYGGHRHRKNGGHRRN
jgi:hypothetical protein